MQGNQNFKWNEKKNTLESLIFYGFLTQTVKIE